MKNTEHYLTNSRFNRVQEEFKNLLAIIMGVTEDLQEDQTFEYFSSHATSKEDISLVQTLMQSTKELELKAKNYHDNIGISTTKVQKKGSRKQISHEAPAKTTTIKTPQVTKIKDVSSKIKDDFDIEH